MTSSVNIHPSIFSFTYQFQALSLSQLWLGTKQGAPWTGCQSITGITKRDNHSQSHSHHLESPVNLTCLWTVLGSWNNQTDRENMQTPHTNNVMSGCEELSVLWYKISQSTGEFLFLPTIERLTFFFFSVLLVLKLVFFFLRLRGS